MLTAAHLSVRYNGVTAYSYGEPRCGNPTFADWLDQQFCATSPTTTRFFRTTHEDDGIVVIPGTPATALGYKHHGIEYWSRDPWSPANTYTCGGETLDCCAGQNGTGINAAHRTYFGINNGDCPVGPI
jgi:feruloyl esterase